MTRCWTTATLILAPMLILASIANAQQSSGDRQNQSRATGEFRSDDERDFPRFSNRDSSQNRRSLSDLDFNTEEDDYFSPREAERTDTALGGYYTGDDDANRRSPGIGGGVYGYGGHGYGYQGYGSYDGGGYGFDYPRRYYTDEWWAR